MNTIILCYICMKVHLVLYANNEPFITTKQLTIQTVHNYTSKPIVIHDYNLEKIKKLEWFKHIADLPSVCWRKAGGRRDGYYNSWKAFITRDVFNVMDEGDLLYYVDSSRYFREGFTQNIDKLCDIAFEKGCIAGSVGNNITNEFNRCCENILVWNKIITDRNNSVYLDQMHVLNSWFILKKCNANTNFVNEWVYFTIYHDDEICDMMVTYHHTADQSIFNILVCKYNFPVFYKKDIKHDENKNKNIVLEVINTTDNPYAYFINLA